MWAMHESVQYIALLSLGQVSLHCSGAEGHGASIIYSVQHIITSEVVRFLISRQLGSCMGETWALRRCLGCLVQCTLGCRRA